MQKINKITIIVTILIIVCVSLVFCDYIEIWDIERNWSAEEYRSIETYVKRGSYTIVGFVPIVIGTAILQIVLLWLKKDKLRVLSVVIAAFNAWNSLVIFAPQMLEEIKQPLDNHGYASMIYQVTLPGYLLLIISWIIVVVQIWLMELAEDRKYALMIESK